MGRPGRIPCNLANATKLPVRVIAPIAAEKPTDTSVSIAIEVVERNSAAATNAEAAPPNPLNAATSCGMPVISTRFASSTPMAPPTTSPAPITV